MGSTGRHLKISRTWESSSQLACPSVPLNKAQTWQRLHHGLHVRHALVVFEVWKPIPSNHAIQFDLRTMLDFWVQDHGEHEPAENAHCRHRTRSSNRAHIRIR